MNSPSLSVSFRRYAGFGALLRSVFCLALTGYLTAFSGAATFTWDNGGGSPTAPVDGTTSVWSNTSPAVWSNGTTDVVWPNTSSDIAIFGSSNGTAGTVNLGSAVTANGIIFNAATSGNYTIADGGVPATNKLTLAGSTPTITTNVDGAISAVILGSAGLTKSGTGTLNLSSGNTSTFTGGVTINQGTVSFTAVNNLGANTNVVTINNGGTLQYAGSANLTNFGTAGQRPIAIGVGTATIASDATGGGAITIQSAFSYSGSGARTLVLSGTKAGSSNIISNVLGDGTGGATSLEKSGAGGWKLTNSSNTYTGTTKINAGTLYVGVNNALPTATTLYVGTSPTAATLDLNGFNQTVGSLLDSGNGSGVIINSIVSTGTLNVSSGSFSGVISGSLGTTKVVALTKSGSGTLALSGANTYTGQTQVTVGTLLVNGSHVESSAVTGNGYGSTTDGHYLVAGAATLSGSGRIAGNNTTASSNMILVQSGGSLASGNSGIGTLILDGVNMTGASNRVLNMDSGAKFAFELSGNSSAADSVNFWNYASGDFALNSNAIDLTLSGSLTPGTYTVSLFKFFSNAGTTAVSGGVTSGLSIGTLGSGISGTPTLNYNSGGSTIDLTYTVIPEPATGFYVISGLGLLMGIQSLRRRQTGL